MVLSQDEIKERVKKELEDALAYFIERQKLVAQAITEMGLDLNEVAEYGAATWSPFLYSRDGEVEKAVDIYAKYADSDNAKMQKMYELAKRATERNLPQEGIWLDNEQNEWVYSLHGTGCRLGNKITREPIDWDCPDVNSYSTWKFMFHLIWQLSSKERAGKLISTHNWVRHSLEPLINEVENENL